MNIIERAYCKARRRLQDRIQGYLNREAGFVCADIGEDQADELADFSGRITRRAEQIYYSNIR